MSLIVLVRFKADTCAASDTDLGRPTALLVVDVSVQPVSMLQLVDEMMPVVLPEG